MIPMLPPSWQSQLAGELLEPYFAELSEFIACEYGSHVIYPPIAQILRAFDECPFENTKVVILGQDPYHGPNQANGLCFSVSATEKAPPSLRNIFKELDADLGRAVSRDPDLSRWARQGVLLLNATLTVRAGEAGSHQHRGWERFTDAAITSLARDQHELVFLLWGTYARRKGLTIDRRRHLVLESAHPSPLSAHAGFFGNHHFSQANAWLIEHGRTPIAW